MEPSLCEFKTKKNSIRKKCSEGERDKKFNMRDMEQMVRSRQAERIKIARAWAVMKAMRRSHAAVAKMTALASSGDKRRLCDEVMQR